jgi:hypothetical protein
LTGKQTITLWQKPNHSPAFADTIDGNCSELLSITGPPDAEIIAQPSSGKTSISAYDKTCKALAASGAKWFG